MNKNFFIIVGIICFLLAWEIIFISLPSGYQATKIPIRGLDIPVATDVYEIPIKMPLPAVLLNAKPFDEQEPLTRRLKRLTPSALFKHYGRGYTPAYYCEIVRTKLLESIKEFNSSNPEKPIHQFDLSLITSKHAPAGILYYQPMKIV